MTMPREDDLITRLRAPYEFGELAFGFGDSDLHSDDLDHLLVQINMEKPVLHAASPYARY